MRGQLGYRPDSIEEVVASASQSGMDTLVVYIHGGLVTAETALNELQVLDSRAFAPAGAYTLGLVWNSDAVTIGTVLSDEEGSILHDPIDALQAVRLAPFVSRELARPSVDEKTLLQKLSDFTYRSSAARRFLPWIKAVTSAGRPSSLDGAGSRRARTVELTTGPISTAVWERMKRSISLGCDANDPNAVGPRLMKALAKTPIKRVVLVGHSAGAVYATRLLSTARILLPNVKFDVIMLAPALTYREAARNIDTLRSEVCRFRMFALRDRVERYNTVLNDLVDLKGLGTVGQWFSGFLSDTYPGSLLYYVSNALEGPADVPILGMERFLGTPRRYTKDEEVCRQVVLGWLKPEDNVAWSAGSASKADPRPGYATAACRHGDFWDDPTTLASLSLTIRQWTQASQN